MKRIFIFSAVISCLLIIYSAVVAAAPEAGTPNGKSFYSSRPNRAVRTFSESSPTLAPVPEPVLVLPNTEPLPASPISEPLLNKLPAFDKSFENKTFSNKTLSDFSSTVPVLTPPNQTNPLNHPVLSVPEKPAEVRPLSKIDINPMSNTKAERTEVYKKTDESSGFNFLSRTTLPNQPVLAENDKNKQEDQLDELNARLAKIQLEKHNLNETLKLIDKIKSPVIKARTLVDLAEYVSRDSNYKKEAEQLYALAVDGIDALRKGEAIVIKMRDDLKTESVSSSPVTNTKPSAAAVFAEPKKPAESTSASALPATISATTSTPPPRKPVVTLLEEDKPAGFSSPKTESTLKTAEKSEESLTEILPKMPEKAAVILSPSSAISSSSTPAVRKAPILLDDEPEKELISENKANVTEKETTLSPTPPKRPAILLDDEPETPKKEKQDEIKLPSTRKPSLFAEEPNVDKEKEIEKNVTEPPKTEPVKKEEPETIKTEQKTNSPASPAKSQRRTMPGRKVTLEEN
ncbi:MAG: hypothetical protein LBU34_14140 [Planctomycetaceae bacterium]|jgi:hypothetical protein|nr:hypothetical protein [Planctomycetaceae bacterium]